MADFAYHPMFDAPHDDTPWRKLDGDYVAVDTFKGQEIVTVSPDALTDLSREAFKDISFFLRPGHLAQLSSILGGEPERPLRRPRPAEERQHRIRRRAADVPGYRHGHHHGQEG